MNASACCRRLGLSQTLGKPRDPPGPACSRQLGGDDSDLHAGGWLEDHTSTARGMLGRVSGSPGTPGGMWTEARSGGRVADEAVRKPVSTCEQSRCREQNPPPQIPDPGLIPDGLVCPLPPAANAGTHVHKDGAPLLGGEAGAPSSCWRPWMKTKAGAPQSPSALAPRPRLPRKEDVPPHPVTTRGQALGGTPQGPQGPSSLSRPQDSGGIGPLVA